MYQPGNTLDLLLIGLLPPIIAGVQAASKGLSGFLTIRFLSIIFVWIGYQLSPWLAYLNEGRWKSFLLVPQYVSSGLVFSFLSMCFLMLGGYLESKTGKRKYVSLSNTPIRSLFPKIKVTWLVLFIVISFCSFIINIGGIHEIWDASYSRGEGQFAQRDIAGKFLHIISVLSMPVYAALACMASLAIIQERKFSSKSVLAWLGLIVASLQVFHGFSRGAGYAFVILAFLALMLTKRKGIVLALFSVSIAIYLGSVGLSERGNYSPGLGNFLESVFFQGTSVTDVNFLEIGPEKNSLDAMAPWTRKALAEKMERPDPGVMLYRFFWNLNPLPSEFVALLPIGRGLAEIMGTAGYTNITTPSLAEIYYVFGMSGALLMIPLGMIYAYFDKQMMQQPGLVSTICILLCLLSLGIGLHSSVRAMTRPLLYAAVIHLLRKRFFRRRGRVKVVAQHC